MVCLAAAQHSAVEPIEPGLTYLPQWLFACVVSGVIAEREEQLLSIQCVSLSGHDDITNPSVESRRHGVHGVPVIQVSRPQGCP